MICVENNVTNISLERQPLYFWEVLIMSKNKSVHSLKHGVIKSQQNGILPTISKRTKEASYFKNVFKLMSLFYVYVFHFIYAMALWRSEGIGSPGTGMTDSCQLPCECCESNPGPLDSNQLS